ncbi:hypothetical protein [Marivita sp. GX14005]|uniref:hypothetical protein n=1 Tax=Marivita sp. GX14005 TaxID=2942276 RepID=UPI00201988CD|nr:hypothetical protein [Marivita sp. GX14005]MCL3883015.1 hypothetical protein [Marivita sp. GX14005]
MAQVPAVPKTTRARHLLRARLSASPTPAAAMVASERAALALRAACLRQKRAGQVTFLLPLVGPDQVGNWGAVIDRLQATLRAFQRQRNPNWSAAICCQERPDIPDDPRLTFLRFTDRAPGNDKWRKLRMLAEALPDLAQGPGYAMSFDADDLLHPAAVDEMLSRQARGGYLAQTGYVMDAATGDIALSARPSVTAPMRKPFWKLCGSCCAMYHDPSEPASTRFLAEMTQHEHRMFPYLAKLAGQDTAPLSQPLVLYIINHGENFGARRGRTGYKTRFVQRYRITDPDALTAIRRDFALDRARDASTHR